MLGIANFSFNSPKELPFNDLVDYRVPGIQLSLSEGTLVDQFSMNTTNFQFGGICILDNDKTRDLMKNEDYVVLTGLPTLLLRSDYPASNKTPASAYIGMEGILIEMAGKEANDVVWKRIGYFRVSVEQHDVNERNETLKSLHGLSVPEMIATLKLGDLEDFCLV